jgi:TetR/AcrR family fatty acid metabolism transcriptional regulator
MPRADDPVQQQLAAIRRAQILDAAIHVFSEKGFHRATIKDIAAAAGLADGTIYLYFANKEALLLGILGRLNQMEAHDMPVADPEGMEMGTFLRQYTQARLTALDGMGMPIMQVLLAEMLTNADLRQRFVEDALRPTNDIAAHYFRRWAEEGKLRRDDIDALMLIYAAQMLGLIMLRLIDPQSIEPHWAALGELVPALLLDGMAKK